MEFRRAQSLSISSNVILHCNESLSTDIQWTLSRCDDPRCSLAMPFDSRVITNRSDIFIPAKALPHGLYRLNLTVSMSFSPNLNASALVYVKIIPSGLTVNLVPYGTSAITRGHREELLLDPGRFSHDIHQSAFHRTVCRDRSLNQSGNDDTPP